MRKLILLILLFLPSVVLAQTNTFCPQNANCTYTGNNTHSGTETFTNRLSTGNLNDILVVDGVQYANIAAAVTAAGSNQRIILIPSTYAGTECPASVVATLTFWDFRSGTPTCTQNSVSWNQASGSGLHSMARFIQTRNNPSNSDTGIYSQSLFTGAYPASQSLVGLAGEGDTSGAITTPGSTTLAAIESDVALNSTGGTLFQLFNFTTNMRSVIGNTTNVTNAYGIYIPEYVKAGSETITNNYGIVLEPRLVGSSINTALWNKGNSRLSDAVTIDKSTNGASLIISGDAFSNTNAIQMVNTHAGGHTWNIGETQVNGEFSFRDLSVTSGPYWSFLFGGTGNFGARFTNSNTATRTYAFPDFSPVSMSGIIASGTSTLTANAALATVTSQAAITTAATNTLTTDAIEWSYATAPTAGDSLCIVSAYVTAGNVNFVRANPTAAAQNVSALVINWKVIR